MTMSENLNWRLTLDNGVLLILSQHNLLPRIKQFVEVYDKRLKQLDKKISRVDLRYQSGFAVQWKSPLAYCLEHLIS